MGHALALLFGIADDEQAASVLKRQHVTPAGAPCVWPTFPRYQLEHDSYGRHSGTVWPHIQGLWATAALAHGAKDHFDTELRRLAEHAVRDAQFAEIYHPTTGAIYGGLQEDAPRSGQSQGIRLWHSCHRQTWSATAFLRMVLLGVAGMTFEPERLELHPHLPPGCQEVHMGSLAYRGAQLSIRISAAGSTSHDQVTACAINGKSADRPYLPASVTGAQQIDIQLT
jgi:glycogen debranching enzyme